MLHFVKLSGDLWIAFKYHSERASGKSLGNFQGSSGTSGEVRGLSRKKRGEA